VDPDDHDGECLGYDSVLDGYDYDASSDITAGEYPITFTESADDQYCAKKEMNIFNDITADLATTIQTQFAAEQKRLMDSCNNRNTRGGREASYGWSEIIPGDFTDD
jgi:hypothetical protein